MLPSIPSEDIEIASAQFESLGHVSVEGLFDPGLLEATLEDIRELSSPERTHNEGRRENVTQLRSPDPEKQTSLYAILQRAREGAAMLGGSLSLGRGCQLDLLQMDKRTEGVTWGRNKNLVGGVVAHIALEGTFFYTMTTGKISEGIDYRMEPGHIVFENLGKRPVHLTSTTDEDRTALTFANTIRALESQFETDTSRQNAT